jgi:hypothetical protein
VGVSDESTASIFRVKQEDEQQNEQAASGGSYVEVARLAYTLKLKDASTRLYGVTPQKLVLFIVTP